MKAGICAGAGRFRLAGSGRQNKNGGIAASVRLLTNLPTLRRESKFTERLGLKSPTKRNQKPSFSSVSEKRGFVINLTEASLPPFFIHVQVKP
jgi:hypothetical protein